MSYPLVVPPLKTLADLLHRLGDISPERVRMRPSPGFATEADVLAVEKTDGVICELVEGVLVEKAMGLNESFLAAFLIELMNQFVRPRNLGKVSAPDGTMRIF